MSGGPGRPSILTYASQLEPVWVPAPLPPFTRHVGRKDWYRSYPAWGPIGDAFRRLGYAIDPPGRAPVSVYRSIYFLPNQAFGVQIYKHRVLWAFAEEKFHKAVGEVLNAYTGLKWIDSENDEEMDKL